MGGAGAQGGAQRQSRGDTTHIFPHCTSSLAAMVCDGHVGMHAWYGVVWHNGVSGLWCVQVKGRGRGGQARGVQV